MTKSLQVPCSHGSALHSLMSTSQLVPEKPAAQVQEYSSAPHGRAPQVSVLHAPAFSHGAAAHSSKLEGIDGASAGAACSLYELSVRSAVAALVGVGHVSAAVVVMRAVRP